MPKFDTSEMFKNKDGKAFLELRSALGMAMMEAALDLVCDRNEQGELLNHSTLDAGLISHVCALMTDYCNQKIESNPIEAVQVTMAMELINEWAGLEEEENA